MQETKTRTSEGEDPPTPRPQWVRMVAIAALAMLAGFVIAAVQSVTGSEVEPTPDGGLGGSEPDFSLTDEEAIARFEELNALHVRAYENADIGLVSQFAGPGPFKDQVVGELRQLQKDNVTASPLFETRELRVTSNAPNHIEMRQTVIFDVRFLDESGKDITKESGRERLVVDWSLDQTDGCGQKRTFSRQSQSDDSASSTSRSDDYGDPAGALPRIV